jgi:arylformamidase
MSERNDGLMKIFDLSLVITEDLPVWPGDKEIEIVQECSIEKGDVCNLSHFSMSMHCGTHIDVPLHFINNGMDTEKAPLDKFIGRAKVFEFDEENEIGLKHLEGLEINEQDMILFKIKKNCELLKREFFEKNYVAVNLEAAKFLVEKGIKAVGIDYFSIEKYEAPGHPVHQILLQNGITIIEGLDLTDIEQAEYQLICLPLKFKHGNGSPVRAILIKE